MTSFNLPNIYCNLLFNINVFFYSYNTAPPYRLKSNGKMVANISISFIQSLTVNSDMVLANLKNALRS